MGEHNQELLDENTQRSQGKSAQQMNLLAGKLVGETVRTTLGPQGMDKMIVDSMGEVIISNDGATILKEMNIEHPTAKMVVEIAKTQEEEVGDGTTTAVVLASELLKQAEYLLEQNIHPTVITKGYQKATQLSKKILENMSDNISIADKTTLKKLAMTAMTGKVAESAKEHLSQIVVKALHTVEGNNKRKIQNINLQSKVGSSVKETELIQGIVIDKEKVKKDMPEQIKQAKIALIDSALELQTTETDSKISITDPSKYQSFLDMEEKMLSKKADAIINSGANVVFCQKGIDDTIQYLLAKKGIYACRRVKRSDMAQLAKATGATIISNTKDLEKKHLGKAGTVKEVDFGDEAMTFVEKCKDPKAVTILVRASTKHVADEIKRAIDDAIGNVNSSLEAGRIVGGSGAVEIELSRNLTKYSQTLSGKEQLAVNAFAKAMEIIPKTLAENAGFDPVDIITDLKAKHDKGKKWEGINVYTGKTIDSVKEGIIEPLPIKTQAVTSAGDVAIMILRIDDVIISSPEQGQQEMNG
ncbi:MAG: thermosome subunit alpha [Nanobdellota archaeon]